MKIRLSSPRTFAGFAAGIVIVIGCFIMRSATSAVLVDGSRPLGPTEFGVALCFISTGLSLFGLLSNRRTLILSASVVPLVVGIAAMVGSSFETDFGTTQLIAGCFLACSAASAASQLKSAPRQTALLGISGLAVAAAGAGLLIRGLSDPPRGTSIEAYVAVGFAAAGLGMAAIAWGRTRLDAKEPYWLPVGGCLFLGTIRIALWLDFSANERASTSRLGLLTLLGGIVSPILFGVIVHLALRARVMNARLQNEMAERRRAERSAHAANSAKSNFLASMSHEIRTPMNGILGMLDLATDGPLNSEQRDYLETAKDCAHSLLTLINDILDLSKIEAGKFSLECVDFNLHEQVSHALKPLAAKASQKGLRLLLSIDPTVPNTVNGDPLRLRQILTNLIGNAIKFTAAGEVATFVRYEPETADVLWFTVKDTGIGIEAEQQKQIFLAFEQANGSVARKYGGTGLGLAICRALTELLHGKIWVESELGRGSSFHFTARLPRSTRLADEAQPDAIVNQATPTH